MGSHQGIFSVDNTFDAHCYADLCYNPVVMQNLYFISTNEPAGTS